MNIVERHAADARPAAPVAEGRLGREPMRRCWWATLTAVALAGLWTGTAAGATITPTTTADDVTVNGNCTLREAVQAANADRAVDACTTGAGFDTIHLDGVAYSLTMTQPSGAPTSDALGDLDLRSGMRIAGSGMWQTRIVATGEGESGLHTHAGADVVLADLGVTGARGAGLSNDGRLTLSAVRVDGNGDDIVDDWQDEQPGGIDNNGDLIVERSEISNNRSAEKVAGLRNAGTATLSDTELSGNLGTGYSGVGGIVNEAGAIMSLDRVVLRGNGAHSESQLIVNRGELDVRRTTVSDNDQGGLYNQGVLRLSDSAFSGNRGDFVSILHNVGTATVVNTTMALNHPTFGNVVRADEGVLTLRNVTIASNTLVDGQGGKFGAFPALRGRIRMANSIVTGNTSEGVTVNCDADIVSLGYNLIDDATGCRVTGDVSGNRVGLATLLGPLVRNGGATATMAPRTGSPALDAGNPVTPGSTESACATTDQRGVTRPGDADQDGRAVCDIGAYEEQGPFVVDDSYTVGAAGVLTVSGPGVLGNDKGVSGNGAALTAELLQLPQHAGRFELDPDGSFTYVPATGFVGTDVFSYQGVDGEFTSARTARVTITVAPAAGANLVRNPSFEASTAGWGSGGGVLSRVAVSGAPDGSYVARARWASGVAYSVSDSVGASPTVGSVTAGQTYVASCYVRAANSGSVGKPVRIVLRERTPGGAVVRDTIASSTLSTSWKRLAVATGAGTTGNSLGLRCEQTSAVSGNSFDADLMTLRLGSTVGGSSTVGAVWTNASANVKRVSSFTLTGARDIASTRAYLDGKAATSGSQSVRAVIYAGTASGPTSRVATSNASTISAGRAAGWVALSFSTPVRLAAGTYWIGLHTGGTTTVVRFAADTATGALRSNSDSYADGAASSFGTATTSDRRLSMYAIGA